MLYPKGERTMLLTICGCGRLTRLDNLRCHSDISGFYSFHTIKEVLEGFGHCLHLLSANEALHTLFSRKQISGGSGIVQELARQYGIPLKLLLLLTLSITLHCSAC